MKKLFYIYLLCCLPLLASAQELFCTVNIDASQITGDKQVITNMKDAVTRFMNLTKWTNDTYKPEERIKCFLQIIINQRDQDKFIASMNLRIVRPVYNTSYESLIANLSDKNFNFEYQPFQELIYTDGNLSGELTALLSYYAFIAIGLDYDTYSLAGGQPWFLKAQEIVNLSSASQNPGWTLQSANPMMTRFSLMDNFLNNSYSDIHQALYKYHRLGLDMMESDPVKGRKAILESLKLVQKLNSSAPLLRCVRVFVDAKSGELVSVFTKATMNEKNEFLQAMQSLDPTSMSIYNKVLDAR